jgi:sugar O-acyltransferase (sialic acid O-acetyltransferase NeuD family)
VADLVIVGAGDHARVAIETARALGLTVRALVEPDPDRLGPDARGVDGIAVRGGLDSVAEDVEFIVAIGQNGARRAVFDAAMARGGRAATLVHPTALLLRGATIGVGSHVCAAAVIGVDARVGRNVIVNTGATLDHDDQVGDHAFVAPGVHVAGRVLIDEGANLGIGSAVIEGRRIGAWSLVAAGATVVHDVEPAQRVAGVPARPMPEREGESEG